MSWTNCSAKSSRRNRGQSTMAGSGGSWKVAYADFVTAMMAFFMVMWILGQNEKVKQAVAHYFNQPFGTAFKSSEDASSSPPNAAGGFPMPPITPIRPDEIPNYGRPGDDPKGRGRGAISNSDPKAPKANHRSAMGQRPAVFTIHDGGDRMVGTLVSFAEQSADLDD